MIVKVLYAVFGVDIVQSRALYGICLVDNAQTEFGTVVVHLVLIVKFKTVVGNEYYRSVA